jgi:hypothetical protein
MLLARTAHLEKQRKKVIWAVFTDEPDGRGNAGTMWRCFETKPPHDHRSIEVARLAAQKFADSQKALGNRCRVECVGAVLAEGTPVHPRLHMIRSPVTESRYERVTL